MRLRAGASAERRSKRKGEAGGTPRRRSLRAALLTLAIVPSLALTALWGVTSQGLWSQWRNMAGSAKLAEQTGIPAYGMMVNLQKERMLTDIALSKPTASRQPLNRQRERSDASVTKFRHAIDHEQTKDASSEVRDALNGISKNLDKLKRQRNQVDHHAAPRGAAFDYYTAVIEREVALFTSLSRTDDGALTAKSRPLVGLFWSAEMLSRENSMLARGWSSGRFTDLEFADFSQWVGAQRFTHDQQIAPYLSGDDKHLYRKITSSSDWAIKTAVEDAVIRAHSSPGESGAKLPTNRKGQWQDSVLTVGSQLQKLNLSHTKQITSDARHVANHLLTRLLITSALSLLGVVVVVLISIRLTTLLRRRVASLRADALQVEAQLPDLVERLRRGEQVDSAAELPEIEYAADELGRLGSALNTARRSAVRTAISQAEQHRGFEKLLQRLARRTQLLIGLQLKKLDRMERSVENAELLSGLFDLDHLTARLRRYEENLVILGGGQPQRRWRKPARLLDVLRSAQGEVQDYTRIQIEVEGAAPASPVLGERGPRLHERAVGPVVHVLAELMENAASFSKPPTPVEVRAASVGRGIAVEIEDRGLGMEPGQYRAANAMMTDPPEPDVLSRVDDVRLGLYVVARLAAGIGLSVEFRPSAFGGTRVIVLMPAELVVEGPELVSDATPRPALSQVVEQTTPAEQASSGEPHEPHEPQGADGAQGSDEWIEPRGRDEPESAREHPTGVPAPTSPPDASAGVEARPEEQPSGSSTELPRRQRGASMRGATEPAAGTPAAGESGSASGATQNADADVDADTEAAVPAGEELDPSPSTTPPDHPLPRRVRQANLATPLKESPPPAEEPEQDADTLFLRPEPCRSGATIGAFQRQSRKARRSEDPDAPAPPATEDDGRE